MDQLWNEMEAAAGIVAGSWGGGADILAALPWR
jgi:hypothetical protein